MRDVIGVLFLIMGGAAITKHFALGIPFFIVAFFLLIDILLAVNDEDSHCD